MNNYLPAQTKSNFRDGKSEHYTTLCSRLGYHFRDKTLLKRALTRRTAITDGLQSVETGNYQRLEFLGDNVIGLVVSELLFTAYPNYQEGRLTFLKSEYVKNDALAKIAKQLDLGKFLIMGKSDELNGVRRNTKTLADTVESLFGAIFVDCRRNYSIIRELVKKHWTILGLGKEASITANSNKANKTESTKSTQSDGICFPQDETDEALVEAVKYGKADKVEEALRAGASPHTACEEREEYTVGDSLCSTNPWVVSVLELALVANEDSYKKTALLLKYGANPNWNKGYTVVDETPMPFSRQLSVSEMGNFKTKRIYHQRTALHTVANSINEIKAPKKLIALLLQHKANHNAVDRKGRTPIALLRQQLKQFDAEKEGLYK
jgi:dsRNA-specific ribonuclease